MIHLSLPYIPAVNDTKGNNPIHLACAGKNLALVKFLVEEGKIDPCKY